MALHVEEMMEAPRPGACPGLAFQWGSQGLPGALPCHWGCRPTRSRSIVAEPHTLAPREEVIESFAPGRPRISTMEQNACRQHDCSATRSSMAIFSPPTRVTVQ